jgi:adenylate cyclase
LARSDDTNQEVMTLRDAARMAGVSPGTLRRWGELGVIPPYRGRWTRAAAAHARIVAQLREHGHSLEEIKKAGEDGRLAFGYVDELFPSRGGEISLETAAAETGLEPALIERIWRGIGLPSWMLERLDEDDLEALRYMAGVLAAGFPLVAFLQVMRVYGNSLRGVADAEARLFRIYVHEPLVMDGVPATEVAEELADLIGEVLPLATPLMVYLHRHFLQHAVEQDLFATMEADLAGVAGESLAQLRVAICFADLVGFVQFTEEAGDEQALVLVERFVQSVEDTLPGDARVVKNIGDGVMIVGTDPATLVGWALGFQEGFVKRARPRIGVHYGETIYRDGDYYGRNVNLAARIVTRAEGGAVLVSEPVYELMPRDPKLSFEPIGEVDLKGFSEPVPLYVARPLADRDGTRRRDGRR